MKIARYYVPGVLPPGAGFGGVPAADIPADQWATLPAWLQASVDASGAYRKTAPDAPAPRALAAAPKKRAPKPARAAKPAPVVPPSPPPPPEAATPAPGAVPSEQES